MKNNITIKDMQKYAQSQGVSKKEFYQHTAGFGVGVPLLMLATGLPMMYLLNMIPADPATKLVIVVGGIYFWAFKICKPLIEFADKTDPMEVRKPKKMGTYKIITVEGKPVIVDEVGHVVS